MGGGRARIDRSPDDAGVGARNRHAAAERASPVRTPPTRDGLVATSLGVIDDLLAASAPTSTTAVPVATTRIQRSASSADPSRVIRRAPLDADQVLANVDAIPELRARLDSPMPGEDPTRPTPTTMRQHVKKAITNYVARSVGADVRDNAVTLSIAIDGIARVVADELHDPWIRSRLSTRLMDLYQRDLGRSMEGPGPAREEQATAARQTAALAGVLVSNDPVGLHMHGELSKEEAARRVVLMSQNATGAINDYAPRTDTSPKVSADEMFTMLRRRFEAQMMAYTRDEVKRREDLGRDSGKKKDSADRDANDEVVLNKPTAYSTRESTDQMSVRYFNSLFTSTAPTAVTDFTNKATAQLDALGTAVSSAVASWDPAAAVTTRHSSLTPNQERVLQAIEAADGTKNIATVIADLENYAVTVIGLTQKQATAAVAAVRKRLAKFPVTITMPGSVLFENGVPSGGATEYKAATQQHRVGTESEVLGRGDEVVEHVGAYDNPLFAADRGDRYLQFRIWKDRLMSQNAGLRPEEMPKFGALNTGWDTNYGTSANWAPTRPDAALRAKKFSELTTDKERKDRLAVGAAAGDNYYGDLHMVLRDDVRKQGRIVFTATDHGAPHADPLLVLHDALTGEMITNLKAGRQDEILLNVFNSAAKDPINKLTSMLKIEAQIYGTLDLAKDVKQMVIAAYSHPDVQKNVQAFCKKHKIKFQQIDPQDPKLVNAKVGAAVSVADVKSRWS